MKKSQTVDAELKTIVMKIAVYFNEQLDHSPWSHLAVSLSDEVAAVTVYQVGAAVNVLIKMEP